MTHPQLANRQDRALLQALAHKAMIDNGLLPDYPPQELAELSRIQAPARADATPDAKGPASRDLRDLLWASIDNDDSRDLDQLTVAGAGAGGTTKVMVAVADVDSLVKDGSAIDGYARHNTTSVYTAAMNFPMLPEKLSTDLTSLNANEDRLAIVIEMAVDAGGNVQDASIYRAQVRNHAKLTYHGVGAWLEGTGPMPDPVAAVPGLAENLRLQDTVAQRMSGLRHVHGALSLQTIEAKPIFQGEQISDLTVEDKNRATQIIEDFMIGANGVTARYLESRKSPSIRRVVRTPKRWDRIVELAGEHGFRLPDTPNSKALDDFLVQAKAADPARFPDVSLTVIKLLGSGEYVAESPGEPAPGHFGLAVKDYTHSTAPNRRYPDLVTQRLVKAALAGQPSPYGFAELDRMAAHFTEAEDEANKVERQVSKSAAALLYESRIGEQFDGIVTGAAPKGTWVRLIGAPVEGKVVQGFAGLDVGDRVRVQLVSTDVERGYIDFRALGSAGQRAGSFRGGRRR